MRWPRFICSFWEAAFGFDPNDPPEKRAYDRALSRFMSDSVRDSLPFEEMSRELRLREAIARIRRKASAGVDERPYDAATAIRVETEHACRDLDHEDAKILRTAVSRMGMRDLLYPEAAKKAESSSQAEARIIRTRPNEDQIAALRRRR